LPSRAVPKAIPNRDSINIKPKRSRRKEGMENKLINALEKVLEVVGHDTLFPLLHQHEKEIVHEARKVLNEAQTLALTREGMEL
jgi:hypothetical protein